jgi:hypothetical protein
LVLAAYYFVAAPVMDPGNDPERIQRRLTPRASSLLPSEWQPPVFEERGIIPSDDGPSAVWSSLVPSARRA